MITPVRPGARGVPGVPRPSPARSTGASPTRPRPATPTRPPTRPSSAPPAELEARIGFLLAADRRHASRQPTRRRDDMPARYGQRPLHGRRRPGGRRLLHQPLRVRAAHQRGPAFADVVRGQLRLLLGRPGKLGRPADARRAHARSPAAGTASTSSSTTSTAEVARLRAAGVTFRNEIISGPGGKQILLEDPSGNPIELFQPAARDPRHAREPARGYRRRPGAAPPRPRGRWPRCAGMGPDRLHRVRRPARPHRVAA